MLVYNVISTIASERQNFNNVSSKYSIIDDQNVQGCK